MATSSCREYLIVVVSCRHWRLASNTIHLSVCPRRRQRRWAFGVAPFTLLHNKHRSDANNKSIHRAQYRLLIRKNINKSTTCRFMCGSRLPSAVCITVRLHVFVKYMESCTACFQATIKMLLCSIGNGWARPKDWLSFQALNMRDGMYKRLVEILLRPMPNELNRFNRLDFIFVHGIFPIFGSGQMPHLCDATSEIDLINISSLERGNRAQVTETRKSAGHEFR